MRRFDIFGIILLLFFSGTAQQSTTIHGSWKLKSWTINLEMDLNNDGNFSDNLILETSCENEEILRINPDETFYSSKTFNPSVIVAYNGVNYQISEKCNKGSLGFGAGYKFIDNEILIETGGKFILNNQGQLVRVFENAINIFNQDYSEVIETRDLVLIYTKLNF